MAGSGVRIAKRVWPAWRRLAEQHDEPALLLLLSPTGDDRAAERALRESVLEVHAAYAAEAERSGDREPPWCGEWDWVRFSEGVLMEVVECDDLESVLPAVAAALERRGVAGVIDVRARPRVAAPPRAAHLLECRVRVRGKRVRREPHIYRWQPDPDAHEAILAMAARWCRRRGDGVACSLSSGTVGAVKVQRDEDVLERLRDAAEQGIHVQLSAVAADELRGVAARAWTGGVSLVVGGDWVQGGRWQGALAELTGVLRDHADLLAYGFVKRGWEFQEALLDPSLSYDWPQRADYRPRGGGFTQEAFDDVYAPDAFGVQLLGPGYAGRLPDTAAWRQERLSNDAILLEHVDLAAWFDEPFVAFGQRTRRETQPPPPAVLAAAREQLAPILYSPGVLSRSGFAEEREL